MNQELGKTVREAAEHVYAQLGSGLSEGCYQKALAIALRKRGCDVDMEVVVPIVYDGSFVGSARPDLVVNKRLVLELKATTRISEANIMQARAYMRWLPLPDACWRIETTQRGAVINFGPTHLEIVPVELPCPFAED
jgi:GxxExxY protein